MQHLLDDLNEEQKKAVVHGEGPLLVVAGAGSGKTRVITRRIAWLLTQGVPEHAILGVTFTNKAAQEMAHRVADMVPGSRIRLSTFHSACAAFLRRLAPEIGFGHDFSIYDTDDRDRLLKSLFKELDLDPKFVRPSLVGSLISRLKNDGVLPEHYEPREWLPLEKAVARVYPAYQQALRAMNAMDFDDLLVHFVQALEGSAERQARYAGRFRHLLVDEFQDTNKIQYRLVQLLATHGNVCVVGDPDQSIYRFRGADIGNILGFPRDFPGTTVVKLESNYRSAANILAVAQQVIGRNTARYDKVLRPVLPEGEPVAAVAADSGRDEAHGVTRRVRELLAEGARPRDVAVFYRSHSLSRLLEEAFRRAGVPYTIVGDVGFFARREVKDLCAFLQALVNPQDWVSLQRILNVPARGLGPASEARLKAEAEALGIAPGELLLRGGDLGFLSGRAREGVAGLAALFIEAQAVAGSSALQPLELFLERTRYLDEVCRTGAYGDEDRLDNVQELLLFAKEFDRELASRAVPPGEREHATALFLQDVSLASDTYGRRDADAVQLMTVHSAKGLEFDHVFVVGLEEGLFPNSRSMEEDDGLEEERRLFYVACTRARKSLTCSWAQMRETFEEGARSSRPSGFLLEAGLLGRRGVRLARTANAGEETVPRWRDAEPVFHYDRAAATELDADAEPGEVATFAQGELVRHPSFGEGRVMRCFGSGRNAKAEVQFGGSVRILLLEYAKLERLGAREER